MYLLVYIMRLHVDNAAHSTLLNSGPAVQAKVDVAAQSQQF